jgi:hypothetical protein
MVLSVLIGFDIARDVVVKALTAHVIYNIPFRPNTLLAIFRFIAPTG